MQLLLNCYNSKESPARYAIHEVCATPYSDRPLRRDECPLLVQSEWPRAARPRLSLVLRRTAAYGISMPPRVSSLHEDTQPEPQSLCVPRSKSS